MTTTTAEKKMEEQKKGKRKGGPGRKPHMFAIFARQQGKKKKELVEHSEKVEFTRLELKEALEQAVSSGIYIEKTFEIRELGRKVRFELENYFEAKLNFK